MNAELLSSIFAIALSLAFSYIPGLKDEFEKLSKSQKQMIMGIGLVLVAAAVFGLSCGGLVDVGMACDKSAALDLVSILISALISNQSVYLLTKK